MAHRIRFEPFTTSEKDLELQQHLEHMTPDKITMMFAIPPEQIGSIQDVNARNSDALIAAYRRRVLSRVTTK